MTEDYRYSTPRDRMQGKPSTQPSALGSAIGVGASLIGAALTYKTQKDLLRQRLKESNAAELATRRAAEEQQRAVLGASAQAQGGVGLLAGLRQADQMQRRGNQDVAQAKMYDMQRQDAFDQEQRLRKERLGAAMGGALTSGGAMISQAMREKVPGEETPMRKPGTNILGDKYDVTGLRSPGAYGVPDTPSEWDGYVDDDQARAAALEYINSPDLSPDVEAAVSGLEQTSILGPEKHGDGVDYGIGASPYTADEWTAGLRTTGKTNPPSDDLLSNLVDPAGMGGYGKKAADTYGQLIAFRGPGGEALTIEQAKALMDSGLSISEIQAKMQEPSAFITLQQMANSIMGAGQ